MEKSTGSPGRHNRYEALDSDEEDSQTATHLMVDKKFEGNKKDDGKGDSGLSGTTKATDGDANDDDGKTITWDGRILKGKKIPYADNDPASKYKPTAKPPGKAIIKQATQPKTATGKFSVEIEEELVEKVKLKKDRMSASIKRKNARTEWEIDQEEQWAVEMANAASYNRAKQKEIDDANAPMETEEEGKGKPSAGTTHQEEKWGDDDSEDSNQRDLQAEYWEKRADPTADGKFRAERSAADGIMNDMSVRAEFRIPKGRAGEEIDFPYMVETYRLLATIFETAPMTLIKSHDGKQTIRTADKCPKEPKAFGKFFKISKIDYKTGGGKVVVGFMIESRRHFGYFKKAGTPCRRHLEAADVFLRMHKHATYDLVCIGFMVGKDPFRTHCKNMELGLGLHIKRFVASKMEVEAETLDDRELTPTMDISPNMHITFNQKVNGDVITWTTKAQEIRCERHRAPQLRRLLIDSNPPAHRHGTFVPYNLKDANEEVYLRAFSEQNHLVDNRRYIDVTGLRQEYLDIPTGENADGSERTVHDELLDGSEIVTDAMGIETVVHPFLGFERTQRTKSEGKWLMITTKGLEATANNVFDRVMQEFVTGTDLYMETRMTDGVGGYGIFRSNERKGHDDPMLQGYTEELAAMFTSQEAQRQTSQSSPKNSPKRNPTQQRQAKIKLAVLDTSEFPDLHEAGYSDRTENVWHRRASEASMASKNSRRGRSNGSAISIGSDKSDSSKKSANSRRSKSTNGSNDSDMSDQIGGLSSASQANSSIGDNVSILTMETFQSMFTDFAKQQQQLMDQHAARQDEQLKRTAQESDEKLQGILKMSLQANGTNMKNFFNQLESNERRFDKYLKAGDKRMEKLEAAMVTSQQENTALIKLLSQAIIGDRVQQVGLGVPTVTPTAATGDRVQQVGLGAPTVTPMAANHSRITMAERPEPHGDTSVQRDNGDTSVSHGDASETSAYRKPTGKVPRRDDDDLDEEIRSMVGQPTPRETLAAELQFTQQQIATVPTRCGKSVASPERNTKRDCPESPPKVKNSVRQRKPARPSKITTVMEPNPTDATSIDELDSLTAASTWTNSDTNTQFISPSASNADTIQEVERSKVAAADPRKNE